MELLGESVPDATFGKIKDKTSTMEVWDALKALYEGRTTMIQVDLTKKLQNQKLGEDDDVCVHLDRKSVV